MPRLDRLTGSKVANKSAVGHPRIMIYDRKPNCRANPLHPDHMTAHERRTELYDLLATAVVRLAGRDRNHQSQNTGDSSLHFAGKQSGTATPTQRRSA